MKTLVLILLLAFTLSLFAQDKPAYQIFDKEGNKVNYSDMLSTTAASDIVFFGELHNNSISHWLELELTKDLFELKGNKLVLGAEMFEADQQVILDEYTMGIIAKKNFEEQARLWPNHDTDYAPLIDFAATNQLKFVATNIPRRYASMVFKGGFEMLGSLSETAKQWMAPQPFPYDPELSCYKSMLQMGGMGGHASANLPKAQAAKDVTMAHFIIMNYKKGDVFLHYNGAYHSDNFEGIVWYVKKAGENLRVITITTVEQSQLQSINDENMGVADFIIVVDEDITKTYE